MLPMPRPLSGSIPACAGEPRTTTSRAWQRRVYPRVCGGTARKRPRSPVPWGLSPRVRGNLFRGLGVGVESGSIPACAGEPVASDHHIRAFRVYPRVCGGTLGVSVHDVIEQGLSPRVRGNRTIRARRVSQLGSIPACAGEPRLWCARWSRQGVYPRVCGGTRARRRSRLDGRGLSPRVRGNLVRSVDQDAMPGSIPACAGEPQEQVGQDSAFGVYPRVCGGTMVGQTPSLPIAGLSPRVRGNQDAAWRQTSRTGSIPACAGEPDRTPFQAHSSRVYPRVCGGTGREWAQSRSITGLSPRVRGNRPRNRPAVNL